MGTVEGTDEVRKERNMRLKDFVKQTFDDIIQGIEEAQGTKSGATVNPRVRQAHGPNKEVLVRTGRLWIQVIIY